MRPRGSIHQVADKERSRKPPIADLILTYTRCSYRALGGSCGRRALFYSEKLFLMASTKSARSVELEPLVSSSFDWTLQLPC